VVIYSTLILTGAFDDFKRWLIRQATVDIRVQTGAEVSDLEGGFHVPLADQHVQAGCQCCSS
jgi:hypothetical protein